MKGYLCPVEACLNWTGQDIAGEIGALLAEGYLNRRLFGEMLGRMKLLVVTTENSAPPNASARSGV